MASARSPRASRLVSASTVTRSCAAPALTTRPFAICARAARSPELARRDEAHAEPRRGPGLTGQVRGAGPGRKALVVGRSLSAARIAMAAPAVIVDGAGELIAAAQLRATGEAAREIRCAAFADGGEDVAPAPLVAEEVRRPRHHDRVGRFPRHRVDPRKMEAAYAAGLMTTAAARIVQ